MLSVAGSFAAVKLRLHALKAAVKKTVGPAAAATAVTREVPGYAHGGGGYAFRQRKAAGALAEPLAGQTFTFLVATFVDCHGHTQHACTTSCLHPKLVSRPALQPDLKQCTASFQPTSKAHYHFEHVCVHSEHSM